MSNKKYEFLKDDEAVLINNKRFVINQSPPTMDIIHSILEIQHRMKTPEVEIKRIENAIDLINEAYDKAIIDKDLNTMFALEDKKKEKQKELFEFHTITLRVMQGQIKWLLGDEGVKELFNIKMNVFEMSQFLLELMERNPYCKEALAQQKKQ